MNIDVSLFDFSTQDYVLRSVSSMYAPLLIACAIVLASFLLVPVSLVPAPLPPELPVTRVILLAFLAGILRRIWRGELPSDVLRPRRLHLALGVRPGRGAGPGRSRETQGAPSPLPPGNQID